MISNEEFNDYYEKYKKLLKHISKPYTKKLDRHDIKSAELDVLWNSIKCFNQSKGQFTTYLYGNLRRKLNTLLKKKEVTNCPLEDIEITVDTSVVELLEKLPANLAVLIHQKYIEKYSNKELAKIHNVTSQTIKNRLDKAKLILKKEIDGV